MISYFGKINLDSGRMLVNGSSFYCGNSTSSLCELALKSDIPSVTQYVHPSTKQCNYTPDLSNINAAKLQGYTYSQIINNATASTSIKIVSGTKSVYASKVNTEYEMTISYTGFSAQPALSVFARSVYNSFVRPASAWINSININSAHISAATTTSGEIQIYWFAIGT